MCLTVFAHHVLSQTPVQEPDVCEIDTSSRNPWSDLSPTRSGRVTRVKMKTNEDRPGQPEKLRYVSVCGCLYTRLGFVRLSPEENRN